MTVNRRQSERGYALIFVFAMSAMMAMMLYLELPRLALEMQRNREELLIERGEQYVRAIKVFTKKNKKYPQTIEELEGTNGVRFLRRRYLDPMSGKDEWRLIHADASGRLTDSLVQKAAVPGGNGSDQNWGEGRQYLRERRRRLWFDRRPEFRARGAGFEPAGQRTARRGGRAAIARRAKPFGHRRLQ